MGNPVAAAHEEAVPVDLREYLQILRRRKWTLIATVLTVVAAGGAYSFAQEPLYTASARILVEPISTSTISGQVPPVVNLETQRELVSSEPVAAIVRDDLGLDTSLESILAPLSVDSVIETEVLTISYTSEDPELARDAADAFAVGFLDYRTQQGLEDIGSEEGAVQSRIDAASRQLADLSADLEDAESAEDEALVSTLESSRNVLLARLGVLQQQLDDLQASRTARLGGGSVIEAAEIPSEPSSPDHVTNLVLATLVGLALGVGLAFLAERMDDRLRDRTDVQTASGAPVLATIPKMRTPKKGESPLTLLKDSSGPAAEAYRTLRTGLQFVTSQRNIKSVLITSPSAEEGKTTTTANLGVALAQAGRRVILVSADLRRPALDGFFGLEGETENGLSMWLAEPTEEFSALVTDPGIPNLRLVRSGPIPPNPAELLNSPLLSDLLRLLEQNSDLVLIDCAPILPVTDASIVSSRVGGTLVVVDANRTHRSALAHARDELERVGAQIVGAVFNVVDVGDAGYSYYQSGYYRQPTKGNGKAPQKRRRISMRASKRSDEAGG